MVWYCKERENADACHADIHEFETQVPSTVMHDGLAHAWKCTFPITRGPCAVCQETIVVVVIMVVVVVAVVVAVLFCEVLSVRFHVLKFASCDRGMPRVLRNLITWQKKILHVRLRPKMPRDCGMQLQGRLAKVYSQCLRFIDACPAISRASFVLNELNSFIFTAHVTEQLRSLYVHFHCAQLICFEWYENVLRTSKMWTCEYIKRWTSEYVKMWTCEYVKKWACEHGPEMMHCLCTNV